MQFSVIVILFLTLLCCFIHEGSQAQSLPSYRYSVCDYYCRGRPLCFRYVLEPRGDVHQAVNVCRSLGVKLFSVFTDFVDFKTTKAGGRIDCQNPCNITWKIIPESFYTDDRCVSARRLRGHNGTVSLIRCSYRSWDTGERIPETDETRGIDQEVTYRTRYYHENPDVKLPECLVVRMGRGDIEAIRVDCSTRLGFLCARAGPGVCDSNPCQNGGTCGSVCWPPHRCLCFPGYTGLHCETEKNECASSPCENGGDCRDYVNKYMCDCKPGYSGHVCRHDINECDSAPCHNSGICTQANVANYFACMCPNGFAGTVCEWEAPGDLRHNCSDWVAEYTDLQCLCVISKVGRPPALVGWNLRGNDSDLTSTLLVKSVRKEEPPKNYACQMTWIRPGYERQTKNITYEAKVAFGPTDNDTEITGNSTLDTDGLKKAELSCRSRHAKPQPAAQWEGVACDGSNYEMTCSFQLDPTTVVGKTITVKCTLVNPVFPDLRGSRIHNITVIWKGVAKVTYLTVNNSSDNYVGNVRSQRLKLVCRAIGNPVPDSVEVFLLAGRNTTSVDGGQRLDGAEPSLRNNFTLERQYTVFSPAACGGVDTYRCDARNKKGNSSMRVVVATNCTSAAPTIGAEVGLAGPLLGSAAGLGLLAIAIVAWRRRKMKRERETAMRALGQILHMSEVQRRQQLQDMADAELDQGELEQAELPEQTESSQNEEEMSGSRGAEDPGGSTGTVDYDVLSGFGLTDSPNESAD